MTELGVNEGECMTDADALAFQQRQSPDIFDVPYYKTLEKYMQLLGQDPRQKNGFRNFIVTAVVISITGNIVPTLLELYISLCNKNVDAVIDVFPHFMAATISAIKILNIQINRQNFNELLRFVAKEWKQLKLNNELHVLDETLIQGNKMAQLYRRSLLSALVLFLLIPLISPIMDIVLPLNKTRPRQQLLKINYIIFDDADYFFYVYIQLAWSSIMVVVTIISVDSLYILLIHHSSGLFAVCGHRVQNATKNSNASQVVSGNYKYEQIRNCIIIHDEAIQFYNILNESSRNTYLIQVGLNMLIISATAVQAMMNLDTPEEAIRSLVFCGANQFHLFVLSLPGQVLLDHCAKLANNIYNSTWYGAPVQIQKILYVMQIRSAKPCRLTAGGLYEMNIENFGVTFKTCMSYITMLMSLK
ncbi:odorant receptor 9a-like [Frieseomelitta varia]|uniref:odorant receptor 9a-like n=1 Tax=Frieseomelitta varia TaxID=561572 RepID=UPI001CB69369|nr:odorant receptor 9a-like [Frieseomelitta varia]